MKGRKLFVLAGLATMVLLQSFMLKSDSSIKFRDDNWITIGKEAKAENKMIFVMVTADWCAVCKRMQGSLADGKVGDFYNSNFVSAHFDADNSMQQFRASNWGVTNVPAMVFLDSKRNVVHKVQGFRDAAGMLKEAEIAIKKK